MSTLSLSFSSAVCTAVSASRIAASALPASAESRCSVLSRARTSAAAEGSVGVLAQALKSLPVGTAYAVWTGIGAAGTAIVGMIWLGESRDVLKIVSLVLLLSGIVGLRLSASE